MRFSGQSAIEFLSTYAFAFLVIGVALALLFVFSSIPQRYLPTQCTFYNGFSQSCDALYYNTTSGANLTVIATDAQPGVVNVSSFSGYINFGTSTSGTCSPTVALAGQTIYCTAQFSQKPQFGTIYTGTFNVKANYCANAPSNISNSTCPSSTTFVYSGSVRAQAAPYKYTGVFVVPITITNSQATATPTPFQQMVQFVPNTYAAHENGNLGNVRFYYRNIELPSWCEANCTNSSSGKATFWMRLPSGMPASSSIVVNMYILPKYVNYDGRYAGEAPQLSPSYAKYDNGQSIFSTYFNGNTSLSSFTTGSNSIVSQVTGLSYGSKTIDALSLSIKALNASLVYIAGVPAGAYIAESNIESANSVANTGSWAGIVDSASASNLRNGEGATTNCGGLVFGAGWWSNGPGITCASSAYTPPSNTWLYADLIYPGTASTTFTADIYTGLYSTPAGTETATANPLSNIRTFYFGLITGAGGGCCQIIYINWGRLRAYPPSGVMPTTSFGSIAQLQ